MNKNATGKKSKRGPELAQRIRAGILNAFDCVEKDGKLISEILAEELKSNPLKFMDMASKFVPKDIAVEAEVFQTVINAQPEMNTSEWQKKHELSGDHSQDHKPH